MSIPAIRTLLLANSISWGVAALVPEGPTLVFIGWAMVGLGYLLPDIRYWGR